MMCRAGYSEVYSQNMYQKFEAGITKELLSVAREVTGANPDLLKNNMASHLANILELESPRLVPTERQKHILIIGLGFLGILDSFETLSLASKLIRSKPPRIKISWSAYIRYNVENYFIGVVTLRNRFICYLKSIKKAYKYDAMNAKYEIAIINKLRSAIESDLVEIIKERDIHIHSIKLPDADLDRAATVDLLAAQSEEFVLLQ
ncbi:MAG: hypothetical protein PHR28_07725 [candidate division Zixibacteria bacterium]|nr:hypothetical protein [candidate division Zixibacteria bacterium]